MKFKSTFLFIILYLIVTFGYSQQKKQVIFIWDVTKSMTGQPTPSSPYKEENNIFDDVKKGMVEIVNNFGDNELVDNFSIYPFRTNVENKQINIKNTEEGRKQAIDFINNYQITPGGNTNICGAMEEAMSGMSETLGSIVYLFTDGKQNSPNGCLPNTIESYCLKAEQSDAYTFFISLNANYDVKQKNLFKNACLTFIEVADIKEQGLPKFIYLIPRFSTLRFNQNTTVKATQLFDVVGPELPDDFTFSAKVDYNTNEVNANFALKEKSNLKLNSGKESDFELKFYDNLNLSFNDKINGKIILENPIGTRSYIKFAPESFNFELINKEEILVNILGFGNRLKLDNIDFGIAAPKDTLTQNFFIECNESAINSEEYIDFQLQNVDGNTLDKKDFDILLNSRSVNVDFFRINLNTLQAKPVKNKLSISIIPKGSSSKEYDGKFVIVDKSNNLEGLILIKDEVFNNDNFKVEYTIKLDVPWNWLDWLLLVLSIVIPIILLVFILTRNNMPFGDKTFKGGTIIPNEGGNVGKVVLKDLKTYNLSKVFGEEANIEIVPSDSKYKKKMYRFAKLKSSSMITLKVNHKNGEESINSGYKLFHFDDITIELNGKKYKFKYLNSKNKR